MRRLLLSCLAALALGGCGLAGGEDFAVESSLPKSQLMQIFAEIDINEGPTGPHGVRIERTIPGNDQVQFATPGSGDMESTILLRFEALANGNTKIHATIDGPGASFGMDGAVEGMLDRLALSGDTPEWRENFVFMLVALAAAAEPASLEQEPAAQQATEAAEAEVSDPEPDAAAKASTEAEAPDTAEDPNAVGDDTETSEELFE